MPRRSPCVILLTAPEKAELESIARKYTLPYYQIVGAKIVLLAAQGLGNTEIAEKLEMPREVLSKWRKRFFARRLEGLGDAPRRGRPAAFSSSGGHAGEGVGV